MSCNTISCDLSSFSTAKVKIPCSSSSRREIYLGIQERLISHYDGAPLNDVSWQNTVYTFNFFQFLSHIGKYE